MYVCVVCAHVSLPLMCLLVCVDINPFFGRTTGSRVAVQLEPQMEKLDTELTELKVAQVYKKYYEKVLRGQTRWQFVSSIHETAQICCSPSHHSANLTGTRAHPRHIT